eukprot:m.267516 g.267516  ORF g.267516 m.267516 type:complete len:895 (-) comp26783_c0_seq11:2144-4828(-)
MSGSAATIASTSRGSGLGTTTSLAPRITPAANSARTVCSPPVSSTKHVCPLPTAASTPESSSAAIVHALDPGGGGGGGGEGEGSTNDGMQDLIEMVNKVQDAFSRIGGAANLDLPQIAVVGGQSAGKSSVLENFVGKDFLPRGSGICTRRPLVLQLQTGEEEYGEFLHAPNKRFRVGQEVREEIENETDRETGGNLGISSIPINLKIVSPQVLNLTLIDLPGLTKVAVGDQPIDIEEQIRGMIMEFICKDSCIILAVSPANSDLANSDALKLAKSVDPAGVRTIGVITKLDLMDAGTDASEILANKFLPLRRGYVGVVNRSQKDINGNKDIKAALASERKFFLSHPAYRSLADKMGTRYLQIKLNQQLINHIRDTLPQLRADLQANVNRLEKDVRKYKAEGGGDSARRNITILMKLLVAFQGMLTLQISGTNSGDGISFTELGGGAKITRIFKDKFALEMAKVDLDESELRREIAYAIRNLQGVSGGLTGFTPEAAFDTIVKRLIENMLDPCLHAVEFVAEQLQKLVNDASMEIASRPLLRDEVERICRARVSDAEIIAKEQVETCIKLETSFINMNHPDFRERVRRGADSGSSKPELLRKGMVIIVEGAKGGLFRDAKKLFAKDYWVVVTTNMIVIFKDKTEEKQINRFRTQGLKIELVDSNTFTIYDPEGDKKPTRGPSPPGPDAGPAVLWKTQTEITLQTKTEEDRETWQAALLRAGIKQVKKREADGDDDLTTDPALDRQVDQIRNLTDTYLKIVQIKMIDTIPKLCMHTQVNSLKTFIQLDLLNALYDENGGSPDELLEESEESQQVREQAIAIYEASSMALGVINDVITTTKTESLPPPVENRISVEEYVPAGSDSLSRSGSSRAPPPPGRPSGRPPPPSRPGRPGRP